MEGLPDSQIFIYDLKTFKVRQGLYVGEVYLLLPDYSYLVIFSFRRITFFIFLFLKFQLILSIFQIFRKLKKNSRNIIGFIKIVQFVHCGLALLPKYSLQPVHTVDWLCPW